MHVWHSYQCGSRHSTIGGNRRSAKSGKLCLVCGWHHGTDMGNAPKIYIIGCLQIPSYYTWVANWIAIGNLLYTNDTNDKSCSQFFLTMVASFTCFSVMTLLSGYACNPSVAVFDMPNPYHPHTVQKFFVNINIKNSKFSNWYQYFQKLLYW